MRFYLWCFSFSEDGDEWGREIRAKHIWFSRREIRPAGIDSSLRSARNENVATEIRNERQLLPHLTHANFQLGSSNDVYTHAAPCNCIDW